MLLVDHPIQRGSRFLQHMYYAKQRSSHREDGPCSGSRGFYRGPMSRVAFVGLAGPVDISNEAMLE